MRGVKHRNTEIAGYEGNIPIVICNIHPVNRKLFVAERGANDWRFYCQYCRYYHHHGAKAGHRVAHCSNARSPFRETGYILMLREDVIIATRAGV